MPDRAARIAVVLFLLLAAAGLRVAWPTADPPTHAWLGIVWHDEGAWVHNARNRALWGVWRTDEWNPMFIAPVFTALEYIAFSLFGVGTWQARTVPIASGLAAVGALGWGLGALAGRRAGLVGASLLATNYVFVMWNRAALMESTMTAFIVAAWAAYAAAARRPWLGLAAGAAAAAAWFTKAAAAFFIAALVLDAALTIAMARVPSLRRRLGVEPPEPRTVRAAVWTLAGAAAAALVVFAAFVLPNWTEYRFYNWQMSVTRKPEYTVGALVDRASWLPIVHDYFTRMWMTLAAGGIGLLAIVARWRTAAPAERLLVLWVLVGIAQLVVHDSGNERRYVVFIPAFVALTALVLGRPEPFWPRARDAAPYARWLLVPFTALMGYLVLGSLVRLGVLFEIRPAVRISAALAAVAAALLAWRWDAACGWLSRQRVPGAAAAVVTGLVMAGDVAQYAQWAWHRTSLNHEASQLIGRTLPAGTLVHGKLANGLALENRIRPVFVGRGFGNYADRRDRDDVRYILTYIAPSLGYESQAANPIIADVLDAYPRHHIIMTFPVAETSSGHDRAALIDKFEAPAPAARARATAAGAQ
jgi:4-amino-4-deoxy-L-arabinose transferase-like glycosyltransferase